MIQHIYDTHFEGADREAGLVSLWRSLEGRMEDGLYRQVEERLAEQSEHAMEWRDRINTYFLLPVRPLRTIFFSLAETRFF